MFSFAMQATFYHQMMILIKQKLAFNNAIRIMLAIVTLIKVKLNA